MITIVELVDGESGGGVYFTDPDETITHVMKFSELPYDINIPAEIMFASVNGVKLKIDFAKEYQTFPFTIYVNGKLFVGVFDINEDFNNPTILELN